MLIKKKTDLRSQSKKVLKKPLSLDKKPVNHHDMFFKSFYSKTDFAFELFQIIFSKKELKAFNWKKLRAEKDSLKEKKADLVFSVPLKGYPETKVKIFILLEHKSSYDPKAFIQLLSYQSRLHEGSFKCGQACPIIPVLFHNGKIHWKWGKTFQENVYKGILSKIPNVLRKNMINYEVKLLDINNPKLRKVFKDKSIKSRGALYLLKKIWGLKNPSQAELKEVLGQFGELSGSEDSDLIAVVSEYLQSVSEDERRFKELWQEVEKELLTEGVLKKGGYMDTLQYVEERGRIKGLKKGRQEGHQEGRQEGLQEGRQEGRQEGHRERNREVILNMLEEKLDISLVSKVTGLSAKEIEKLKNGMDK